MKNTLHNIGRLSIYNMKIIFGNMFVYFLLGAIGIFLLITGIYIFDAENVGEADMYNILIVPGILILFYPSVFGIQNDSDSRTLEIIFAIPDYRFKVWLVRLAMVFVLTFLFLIPLVIAMNVAILSFPVLPMVLSLMPLMLFVGVFGFSLSTIIKNGMGAAAILIILGVVLMIVFEGNGLISWNIFLNPYHEHSRLNQVVWEEMLLKNRIFLLAASVVFLLLGLFNLQKREKFLG